MPRYVRDLCHVNSWETQNPQISQTKGPKIEKKLLYLHSQTGPHCGSSINQIFLPMRKTYIQIGYMDSRTARSMRRLTAKVFEQLVNSEKVRQTMANIENEPDEEKKSQLKQELPVVLYACQMTETGQRPSTKNHLAKESGFCLHDWDHMPMDPRRLYFEQIAGREDELNIVLAHVTPRGSGLRLVTVLRDGEQIAQCQARLAAQFGMEKYADPKVKDITRLSYLPSQDYILYINKEGLFEQEQTEAAEPVQPATESAQPKVASRPAPVAAASPQPPVAEKQEEPEGGVAATLSYNGIKFNQIIEALIKRLSTDGKLAEGERNDVLFALARELRHICEYNFQTVYMLVAPYFSGLPDAEIRRTIGSAIATNGRTITPMMQGVMNELKNENTDLLEEAEGKQLPRVPRLSEVEEMILSHYPKQFRNQVFLAMLPIWGTYGTHIRFRFMGGRVNSLSFMTAIVGKSGSGKGFVAHLFDQMTRRFQIEDEKERLKAEQYQAICDKMSDDAEKPDDPNPRVRIYSDDITTSQLLDYLRNLKGEHGLQFTEEVARLQKAKRTIYGDNDDLYCKAFDNSVGGKESKSKLTKNIRIPIFLNTIFAGTPGAMHKFYNNPEGGLNNRVIYAFMPNIRVKGFLTYSDFNEQEQAQFDDVTNRLWEAGQDLQLVKLPWLEKDITYIKNKWDKEDNENPDEVWYDLGKRALILAMRTGVLQWFLRGCPTDQKQLREIGKVVKWVAEAVRQCVYAFCGQDYEKINEEDNAFQQQQNHMTKNKKLFSLLPEVFTTQELITLRVQNGGNSNVAMVICRWTADGLIRKIGDGRFRKVPQLAG